MPCQGFSPIDERVGRAAINVGLWNAPTDDDYHFESELKEAHTILGLQGKS